MHAAFIVQSSAAVLSGGGQECLGLIRLSTLTFIPEGRLLNQRSSHRPFSAAPVIFVVRVRRGFRFFYADRTIAFPIMRAPHVQQNLGCLTMRRLQYNIKPARWIPYGSSSHVLTFREERFALHDVGHQYHQHIAGIAGFRAIILASHVQNDNVSEGGQGPPWSTW